VNSILLQVWSLRKENPWSSGGRLTFLMVIAVPPYFKKNYSCSLITEIPNQAENRVNEPRDEPMG